MKKELRDCMTSELLFQALKDSTSKKDIYIAEYERRLKIMGLSDDLINKFKKADETVINNGCYMKLDTLLASVPFIEFNMDKNSIKVENCTFSELVYLTDDANSAYIRDHHILSPKTWELVCQHAFGFEICKAAFENRNRMKAIGLTLEQEGIFVKNECQIAKKLRWHYSDEFAWV